MLNRLLLFSNLNANKFSFFTLFSLYATTNWGEMLKIRGKGI